MLRCGDMPLRPIIEGETNWDNIDEGSEPADIEFLEQFANEGGVVRAAEMILENYHKHTYPQVHRS